MGFGFACGDGWFETIKDLCEKLQALNLSEEFEVLQVKEKFGGLRFYVTGVDAGKHEEVQRFIRKAEEKSFKTCEDCGKPGKPNTQSSPGAWISTLCRECRKN